jgi:hypothetical protein
MRGFLQSRCVLFSGPRPFFLAFFLAFLAELEVHLRMRRKGEDEPEQQIQQNKEDRSDESCWT